MSIVVENISRSYNQLLALDDVSFTVNDSEIFGLIGPDGAGKTSLFRILVTLLLADKGQASINGFDVVKEYSEIRRIIGYMPGRFSLYQDLSVRENLEFYATVFGTTIEKNYDLVRDIYSHIEPFEKRLAGRLSGGMKQKLALSCALIHRPEVLILDEPTTGVDAVSRKEFWDMLAKIRQEGITILVSTPYMDEAALCDRVALLQKGKLLLVSKPEEIATYSSSIIYAFSAHDSVYAWLARIREADPLLSAYLFGDEIHVYFNSEEQVQRVENIVQSWHVEGLTWNRINAGVEDYFMQIMTE